MSNIEYFLNLYTLNMRNNKLYNNLINDIAKSVKHAINESVNFINDNGNNIKKVYLYPKESVDDLEYLNTIKKDLWTFMDDGYRYVGLDGFSRSCLNYKSLKKNSNMIKLIYCDDILISASIYSGRDKGYKCVGITATTNKEFRKLGVKYVHHIIEEDIMNYEKYFWTVCSGSLEKIYEEHGGIKIPNEYIPAFKLLIDYDVVTDDEYAIAVKLNDGELYKKVIYGFNSKESLEAAISERDARVLERINRIKKRNTLHETIKYNTQLTDIEQSIAIINVFYEERCNGLDDLSPELYDILKQNIDIVDVYIKNNTLAMDEYDMCITAVENGNDILDSSTLIKIYKG